LSYFEKARFRKAEPEEIYHKNQKVWVDRRGWIVTNKTKPRHSFGKVEKTSKWPDLWVTIGIWNKEEYCAWDDWDRGIVRKPSNGIIKRIERPSWKGPKISGKKKLASRFISKKVKGK